MSDQPMPETPTYEGDWWNHLPSVDGEEPRLEREPEMEPTEEGLAELARLQAALEERAEQPDVKAFIEQAQHE